MGGMGAVRQTAMLPQTRWRRLTLLRHRIGLDNPTPDGGGRREARYDGPDVEVLFRQQFRHEIREGHYTIDFALSGEAALDMLAGQVGEEIGLLVSDINMPGMDGLDL